MENSQNKNQWDDALENQIIGLKECQKSYNLDSCTPCEKFFDCEIRKKYVIAVYESMNKGSTGGFEF
ncbi:MAG: hypothetical protein C0626_02235 [Arcobacter sp.]|uniref:hypothetical protein n=1 Tax=uncultured Arcobacter sp. TaxID=165434 RepID=UPI000CB4D329|nr:hypothetical protein [uncultured Arcobacter sp.]PLY11409.1 MAG: hypothetical protein C0626_02235 [Arcobacter sp.]